MKLRIYRALAVSATAVLIATACGNADTSEGSGSDVEVLKVSTLGSMADAALQIAIDKGYFAEEGVRIETTVISVPPAAVAAVQSGEVDISYLPAVPLINAVSQGIGLTAVAGADELPEEDTEKYDDGAIVASPDSGIESFADLEGKKVAVPARSGQFEMVITDALIKAGVDPETVEWVALDFSAAIEAVKNHSIDVASMTSPFTAQALDDGMKLLGTPSTTAFGPGAGGMYVASDQVVEDKTEALEKFRRAIYKANAYANEHVDETVALGIEIAGFDVDPSQVTPLYWATDLEPNDIDSRAKLMADLGFLKGQPGTSVSIME
ncbi:hypothetical protein E4J89_16900 [Arthrobacter sp. CAU 1506]|uniref:ABC transporter substrate-binding protein n=1 Tax=Arthrobacter sp. CAU 1506 TaxID=2560052 RepID=UPI0010ABF0D8|nr:ABC transporter substrate-binding protein [Arthrobacter sp. CAU 1506]TJY66272.1 hypothetical protein E4J89_16900 [Arthrobacter sp. CAU 1506]